MADRHPAAILKKIQANSPLNSTQLLGLLTLLISGAILLILICLTFTATVVGLIFFTPLVILSSPIWVPVAIIFFLASTGVASFSWTYRYFKGLNPPGADQVDYARSRIYDTASNVKDYAKEYGGYLQSNVKDVAPGA